MRAIQEKGGGGVKVYNSKQWDVIPRNEKIILKVRDGYFLAKLLENGRGWEQLASLGSKLPIEYNPNRKPSSSLMNVSKSIKIAKKSLKASNNKHSVKRWGRILRLLKKEKRSLKGEDRFNI